MGNIDQRLTRLASLIETNSQSEFPGCVPGHKESDSARVTARLESTNECSQRVHLLMILNPVQTQGQEAPNDLERR
jgi:hypothetical protein